MTLELMISEEQTALRFLSLIFATKRRVIDHRKTKLNSCISMLVCKLESSLLHFEREREIATSKLCLVAILDKYKKSIYKNVFVKKTKI